MFKSNENLLKGLALGRRAMTALVATSLFAFTFVGCADDEIPNDPNKGNGGHSGGKPDVPAVQTTEDESLTNLDGLLVLSEGNFSNENGTLSFINMAKADYPATNWIFQEKNKGVMLGNVAQSLYVDGKTLYVLTQNGDARNGSKHVVVTDKDFHLKKAFNPGNFFAGGYGKGVTPKRIAILGHTAFVADSNGVLYAFDKNDEATAPTKIEEVTKVIDGEMVVVKENGKKVLYAAAGNAADGLYRIDESKAVTTIGLNNAEIANIIPVQRKHGEEGYLWAVGSKGDKIVLFKVKNGKVEDTYETPKEAPVGSNRGACYYQGGKDIVYFTIKKGEWSSHTTICKFDEGSKSFTKIYDSAAIEGVLTKHISYNHIAVSQKTGEVFFPVVEDWSTYKNNAIIVIDNGGKVTRWYASTPLTKYKDNGKYTLDSRFPAGIYAISDFVR